ncbi:MAG: hypothetical protein RIC38_01825 [Chromatocurvus sp.]
MALNDDASTAGYAAALTENDSDTAHPSLTERQQFWLEHIRLCDAGRIATKAYAEQHDLSVQAMYSARKDLVARGVANPAFARFARVTTTQEPSPVTTGATTWRIDLPNGTAVSFEGPVDDRALRQVLQAAGALS